jgi:antirestriction protein ArdC
MKGDTVFNVERVDGLSAHFYAKTAPRTETLPPIELAESFMTATSAAIRHGGDKAYCSELDGVTAVTTSVIAHGPDNSMILLGCVGVSAVKQ